MVSNVHHALDLIDFLFFFVTDVQCLCARLAPYHHVLECAPLATMNKAGILAELIKQGCRGLTFEGDNHTTYIDMSLASRSREELWTPTKPMLVKAAYAWLKANRPERVQSKLLNRVTVPLPR